MFCCVLYGAKFVFFFPGLSGSCCFALCVLQIVGFSVALIILADLLGNKCLLARVQKVMLCDL